MGCSVASCKANLHQRSRSTLAKLDTCLPCPVSGKSCAYWSRHSLFGFIWLVHLFANDARARGGDERRRAKDRRGNDSASNNGTLPRRGNHVLAADSCKI